MGISARPGSPDGIHASSQVFSAISLPAIIGTAIALLVLVVAVHPATSVLPIAILCVCNGKISAKSGMLLAIVYTLYLGVLFSPLFYLFGWYYLLVLYAPLLIFVMKRPHEEASEFYLKYLYIMWDLPQLIWVYIASTFSMRALEPFISDIDGVLSVGSMPLDDDVPTLASRGVGLVINMCIEYSGPTEAYSRHNITQLRLPTPDVSEVRLEDIQTAIKAIDTFSAAHPGKRVFVHCKGGVGRAATVGLCYLIHTGLPVDEAMLLLRTKREVVSSAIRYFHVVQDFSEKELLL